MYVDSGDGYIDMSYELEWDSTVSKCTTKTIKMEYNNRLEVLTWQRKGYRDLKDRYADPTVATLFE